MGPLRSLIDPRLRGFDPDLRRVVRIEISAALLVSAFASVTGPFTGLILRRDFGASPLQLAALPAAGAVFLLLSLQWQRMLAGRTPLACVVWAGFAARALFLLVPFAHDPLTFIAIVVGANALGTVAGPAQAALVAGLYPGEHRARALGLVRVVGTLPAIGLTIWVGRLLGVVDHRWLFPAAAVLGMMASLCQLRMRAPQTPVDPAPDGAGVSEALETIRGDRELRRLLVTSFVFGTGIWLQLPAHPVLMADVLRIGPADVGMMAGAATAAGIVGSGVWTRMTQWRSSVAALRCVYLVGAAVPLIYLIARRPWVLVMGSMSDALMSAGLDLVFTLTLIEVAGPQRAARYAAISATLAGVRGVLGPLAGAFLIEAFGVRSVYAVAAAAMLCAAALLHGGDDASPDRPRGR